MHCQTKVRHHQRSEALPLLIITEEKMLQRQSAVSKAIAVNLHRT
jgi:hypothetical protein